MEVKIINRTGSRKCECCNSWLKHWERSTKEWVEKCKAKNCSNDAKVGAHVMRKRGDNSWRIVPLCHDCKKRTDFITLNKNTKTASAEQFSCQ